jgi:hypothetical protein
MSFDISEDLPYLKIWHTIPNERINSGTILDDEAVLKRKKCDLTSAKDALAETEKTINTLQSQLNNYKKLKTESENFIKKLS